MRAPMIGLDSWLMYPKMRTGSVIDCGPARNSARLTSSNETMNANAMPAEIPGRMIGNVMRRNAVNGVAPRLRAASSRRMSKPIRLAVVSRIVYGVAMARCPRMSAFVDDATPVLA